MELVKERMTQNRKLLGDGRVYQAICDTSTNAFLYQNFREGRMETVGNWGLFSPVSIQRVKDISKIYDHVEQKYVVALRDMIFLEKTGKTRGNQEFRSMTKKSWIDCEVAVSYDEDGNPLEKVVRFTDITRFKRQNDELSYMAYYDGLTGLFNRNCFVQRLVEWIERAKKENAVVSLLFVDIDNFRQINDGMGMLAGDDIIQQVGQFLGGFQTDSIIASHFNSDLYCLAIYNSQGSHSIERIYHAIQDRMKDPFMLAEGGELNISVCVGVAEYPEAGSNALELINRAEIVMFRAKHRGKSRIQYFDEEILEEFLGNVELENKLKNAVLNESFQLFYQPQFDSKSGKMRGVEALIRWRDEEGNIVSPAEFIPLAEKNGLIVPIGNWVLKKSISTFAAWRDKYQYDMVLSINVSAIQYKKQDFVSRIMSLLKEYHIPPNRIELEITESVLIDDFEKVTRKMHTLREYGIRVSMDDFGTGYSSLSYLKGLPIDTLKIDKSFIDTLATDEATKTITEAMVGMVKKLGLETVAEGVETDDQLAYLKSIDCDNIQGFLLGRPMPEEELERLICTQIENGYGSEER